MARTVQLKVMLTEEERADVASAADKAGEAVSVYVRRAVREQMRRDKAREDTLLVSRTR